MNESNPKIQATILEVVDNQLRDNNPPESKKTHIRLLNAGYSDQEARKLIGAVLLNEMNQMLKDNQVFDEQRYIKSLNRLPKLY